jgi:hypothetical protein
MPAAIEDRAFVTAVADADEVATSMAQESLAGEEPPPLRGTEEILRDTMRMLRRQDIADHGVLFR